MARLAGIPIPKDIEILKPFWNVSKAGKIGGAAMYKKYGRIAPSEQVRREKWNEWWEKKGRRQTAVRSTKHIRIPEKSDREYALVVAKLIDTLFGVAPRFYYRKNARAVNLNVGRKELVHFCNKLGLPTGCISKSLRPRDDRYRRMFFQPQIPRRRKRILIRENRLYKPVGPPALAGGGYFAKGRFLCKTVCVAFLYSHRKQGGSGEVHTIVRDQQSQTSEKNKSIRRGG